MRSPIVWLAVTVLTFVLFSPARDAWAQTNPPNFPTHHEPIPNFAQNPTITSKQLGNWSSPSTWSGNRVPAATDVVLITHTVTYNSTAGDADTIGIGTNGILRFSTTENTSLKVANLLVQPQGTLEIGTQSTPLPANLTAEIVIKTKALNDPEQFGTGLLALGTVTMHGAVKTPTFVRTAVEPRAGNSTVTLEQSVTGWRTGDRIFLPDTRQVTINNWFNSNYTLQVEERTIQNISADGKTITLSAALTYDHRGARDANGTPTVLSNGIKLLPHVGNLTRNIIIRSGSPSGTRGHTLFTHHANVDIRYTQFQDLGRTKSDPLHSVSNHIGRYPLHIHHLWGPANPSNTGYQFELVGNAVNDSLKWPIAVHGSHFGLIRQNVVFGGSQLTGAGIAVEDGTETENLFEANFIANIRGNVNARNTGPSTEDGSTPGSGAECFWAAGFNNRFVNNVASDCRNPAQQIVAGPGFKFIVLPTPTKVRNPRFRGADMTNTSQTVEAIPQRQPILEFRGNEVYGGSADGLTIWELGNPYGSGGIAPAGMTETIIKDFRVWHTYEAAAWLYPVNRLTFDGLVWRVDPAAEVYWRAAVQSGDYRDLDLTIRGGSIHGGAVFGGTVAPLGTINIENVEAITHDHALQFETPCTPGTQAGQPDPPGVVVIMRNNRISAWPGQPLRTISTSDNSGCSPSYPNTRYDLYVYNYQGLGDNFRVYWNENIHGGLPATCTATTRPEIDGRVCPITGSPGGTAPLAAPTNLRVTN